jgi:hypothetical protein
MRIDNDVNEDQGKLDTRILTEVQMIKYIFSATANLIMYVVQLVAYMLFIIVLIKILTKEVC